MRYRVAGLDKSSHKPIDMIVDARSPEFAAEEANRRGIDVAAVTPAEDVPQEPTTVRLAPGETVLIEKTSKSIKAWIVVGVLLMALGAVLCATDIAMNFAYPDQIGALLIPGAVLGGLGSVILLFARLSAWWHHG